MALSAATVDNVCASDRYYRERALYASSGPGVGGTWGRLAPRLGRRYLRPRGLDLAALAEFRRRQLFVVDEPTWDPERASWRKLLDPSRPEIVRGLDELYERMRAAGHRELLEKLPPSRVGAPYLFRRDGVAFTKRHAWALRSLALFSEHVKPRLGEGRLVVADVGGGEGLFIELVRRAYPRHGAILVDFAEQLVLAETYLRESQPDANVLTARTCEDLCRWSVADLRAYDFVLVPIQHAADLPAGVADVVTNFVSFSEMARGVRELLRVGVLSRSAYAPDGESLQRIPSSDGPHDRGLSGLGPDEARASRREHDREGATGAPARATLPAGGPHRGAVLRVRGVDMTVVRRAHGIFETEPR